MGPAAACPPRTRDQRSPDRRSHEHWLRGADEPHGPLVGGLPPVDTDATTWVQMQIMRREVTIGGAVILSFKGGVFRKLGDSAKANSKLIHGQHSQE
jgi:hypothetical protein